MAGVPTFAITDTETGGLDYRAHALTQISIIVVDDELNELENFQHRIIPPPGYTVHPKAAEINGYNEELWLRTGMTLEAADNAYSQFLEQWFPGRAAVGVAHNAQFDAKFIRHHLPRSYAKYHAEGGPDRKAEDGWYCTCNALRQWRSANGQPGSAKLGDLVKLANYTPTGAAHEALQDTQSCLAGLRWLQSQRKVT
jgi:oligoribonuclease (3'-5' exoribonuclease)